MQIENVNSCFWIIYSRNSIKTTEWNWLLYVNRFSAETI